MNELWVDPVIVNEETELNLSYLKSLHESLTLEPHIIRELSTKPQTFEEFVLSCLALQEFTLKL